MLKELADFCLAQKEAVPQFGHVKLAESAAESFLRATLAHVIQELIHGSRFEADSLAQNAPQMIEMVPFGFQGAGFLHVVGEARQVAVAEPVEGNRAE